MKTVCLRTAAVGAAALLLAGGLFVIVLLERVPYPEERVFELDAMRPFSPYRPLLKSSTHVLDVEIIEVRFRVPSAMAPRVRREVRDIMTAQGWCATYGDDEIRLVIPRQETLAPGFDIMFEFGDG